MLAVPPSCRLVIAGHSHVAALGIPLDRSAPEIVEIDGAAGLCGLAGPWNGNRNAAYWQALSEVAEGRTIVINWSGNEHNARFLLHVAPAFDFHVGDSRLDRTDGAAMHVPKLMVAALLAGDIPALAGVVRSVAERGPARLIVLGTPPPKRDLASLAHIISGSDYWQDRARALGQDAAQPVFSPPLLRLKLWTVLQEQMAAAALAGGATFVPVPAAVQDKDGFLRPELWAPDLTHANRDYGQIILKQLAALSEIAA